MKKFFKNACKKVDSQVVTADTFLTWHDGIFLTLSTRFIPINHFLGNSAFEAIKAHMSSFA
jgi:hypothetical protein